LVHFYLSTAITDLKKGNPMNSRRITAALVALLVFMAAIGSAQPKKRIAVSKFGDGSGHHGCGAGVADMLATALVKTKKFMVIERKEIDKVVEEQKLGLSGMVTPETAPAVGKLLGVDLIVIGSVSELGTSKRDIGGGLGGVFGAGLSKQQARAAVDIRLVNTTTGEIVAAETEEGTESTLGFKGSYEAIHFDNANEWNDTDLGKAAREAVDKTVELITDNMENIPWSGRVVKVNNDGTVLMKPGSEGNITSGMEFDVFQLGDEIKDPDTGVAMGSEETKVAHIVVVSDALNGKAAKAKIASGSGIKAGDVIREPK
jgi:curli biogenesis system outer membrane secretion channel CsgG